MASERTSRRPLQRQAASEAGPYSLPLVPDLSTTKVVAYFRVDDASQSATGLLEVKRDNAWFKVQVPELNGTVTFDGIVPDAIRLSGELGVGDVAVLLMDQVG